MVTNMANITISTIGIKLEIMYLLSNGTTVNVSLCDLYLNFQGKKIYVDIWKW